MSETKKTEKQLTLAGKLAHITAEVGAIAKNGRNTQQNYNFISYADVSARLRELLGKYNVAIVPQVKSYERSQASAKGGSHYLVKMEFAILDGDSEAEFRTEWVGESADWGDKGINKAITAGTKYFLMRMFQISESGDDPDAESPTVDAKPRVRVKLDMKAVNEAIANATTIEELNNIWGQVRRAGADGQEILDTFKAKAKEVRGEA